MTPPQEITVRDLRDKYLRFFESKGHLIHDSGSLIPYDVTGRLDESLLFNGAGMVQFKPYFRGVATPPRTRVTTAQKCVRTGDIDEVGDDSHLTFFEMLGNFSFGDYFKKEAIDFSWEFLTSSEWLGLDPRRLSFTVFLEDDEAYSYWSAHLESVGIDPASRIFRLGEETNYWPAGAFSAGPPGPCGPNSEMFYWQGPLDALPGVGAGDYSVEGWLADDDAKNWLEIWNDVFIQYEWQGTEGEKGWVKTGMPDLPFNSIDTGMGIERTVAVLNGFKSVYETDAFAGILAKISECANASHVLGWEPGMILGKSRSSKSQASIAEVDSSARVIADHIRTVTFCIADGALPSNTGRGYVIRRLIRRAVSRGNNSLNISQNFTSSIARAVVETFGVHYRELIENESLIYKTLESEESLFRRTLESGRKLLAEAINKASASFAFVLLQWLDGERSQGRSISLNNVGLVLDFYTDWTSLDAEERNRQLDNFHKMEFTLSYVESCSRSGVLRNFIRECLSLIPKEGLKLNDSPHVTRGIQLESRDAFKLWDQEGFPIELTVEECKNYGIEVDLLNYERLLDAARKTSKGAQGDKSAYGGLDDDTEQAVADAPEVTDFTGYSEATATAKVVRVKPGANGKARVALDSTPFYAESGGQTGDTGYLWLGGSQLEVKNTTKSAGTFWHEIEGADTASLLGSEVKAEIDAPRRNKTQRHHTATHLLQAALRQVLGTHVTQAGSYNGPDNLRFDFTHGKGMTAEEIAEVERIVNEEILKNTVVTTYVDLPIAEARAKGAMALFGEKYGDKVRMVEIGEFSKELCGGTHVRTTGEIGMFRIVSESSAASGVRRIEAITGEAALERAKLESDRLKEISNLLKSTPDDVIASVQKLQDALKEERKKREKAEMAALSGGSAKSDTQEVKGVTLWIQDFGDAEMKIVSQTIDNEANGKPNQVTLGVTYGEKVTFVAKIGADAVAKGAHAGNLLRELAKITGGGGGGRADYATAGGKDPSKVGDALAAVSGLLGDQIKA